VVRSASAAKRGDLEGQGHGDAVYVTGGRGGGDDGVQGVLRHRKGSCYGQKGLVFSNQVLG